ncbi:MAG: hypothetical protein ONB46_21100 [candidate division KSB1 bacterium]|nr:hypothetical protein [candidate division KSB1 bacterium]MDZ7368458.1 hypothetical protein [candidate division KSB1 bacterium]MDZ7406184.1 hypothetical protein [candidate division KSB1 bacterium]
MSKAVEAVKGLVHQTIPPGAHTWQADVETVHGLIEDEFCCVERFNSRLDFLARAGAYNLWFNVARQNSSKGHQTPWEIVKGRFIRAWPPGTPFFSTKFGDQNLTLSKKGGTMLFRSPLVWIDSKAV